MIRNIIFDFGDVFINLDKPATARRMGKFGFSEVTPELDTLFKKYEMGLVSTLEFLSQCQKYFPDASKRELIDAWNAILLDFPEERLQFLEGMVRAGSHRLFLLSNTNELHMECVKKIMGLERFSRFKNCFEVFYLSYKMKLRKPTKDIFEVVLNDNGLRAQETLFVDDTLENIKTASAMGIKTWHLLVGKEDITELIQRLS